MQASNAHTSTLIRSYIYHFHMRRSKRLSCHQSQSESHSYTLKRLGRETSFMTPRAHKQEHGLHQVGESLLCHRILHTWLFKDYVIIKPTLENYEGLTYIQEHIENIKSILELVIQDDDVMSKVLPTMVCRFAQVWYHNLESSFFLHFQDLSSKLISLSNTRILAKKSITKFFTVTQWEDEKIKTYLQKFNKKMLNM